MDTELLKTFIAVYEAGNIGRAANTLFITSAAASARIKLLESQFGATFFVRGQQQTQITPEGLRLLPYAQKILVTLSEAKEQFGDNMSGRTGLSFGTTASLWHYFFAPVLARVGSPMLQRLDVYDALELSQQIESATLDMAVVYSAPSNPEIASVDLGAMRLGLLASEPGGDYRHTPQLPYYYINWGSAFGEFSERRLRQLQPCLHSGLAANVEQIVRTQGGSAYLPLGLDGLHLLSRAPLFSRPLYLVYHQRNPQREALVELAEKVSEVYKKVVSSAAIKAES